jgi:RNA polymerase sigma-70 factor, ECF subfamily
MVVVRALVPLMKGRNIRPDWPTEDGINKRLMQRVAQNLDREAFGELFDKLAPRLKSFMMRKGTSAELAEDLVQEAMILIWTKAGLYDPAKGSVMGWVYTLSRNLRIDRLRRDSTMALTAIDDYDAASDDPGGEEVLLRKQEDLHVTEALKDIPAEQREVLLMSYVEDMPQTEIAERLKLPLGTVKSRMRLAYNRLRKHLETVT